jgi:hypothetical protein
MRKLLALFAVLVLAAFAVSCGDGDAGEEAGMDEDTIHVADAWARSPMQDVGAVYFTAHNGAEEADLLIRVSSPVAARSEIHETVEQDGEMVMHPVASVEIGPGQDVRFEPGGYHIMLFELTEALEVDSTITIVLEFENAGEISVEALVKAYVPDEGMGIDKDGPTGSTADAGMVDGGGEGPTGSGNGPGAG